MKRILPCILALVLLLACVPTPEEDVVVGKNTESMLAQAIEPEQDIVSAAERTDAPERYQTELESAGGHLTVSVDAEIVQPDGALPIVRVEPRTFTEDEVKQYLHVLLGDDPYYYDGKLPKSYWRQRLDAAIDAIEHWDTYGMNYFNEYDTIEEAQASVSALNKRLNEAPDEPQRITPDFVFQPAQLHNKDGVIETSDAYLYLKFVDQTGTFGSVECDNLRETFGTANFRYTKDSLHFNVSADPVDVTNDLRISRAEAEQQALALLQALGFSDFALAKSYGVNACYNEPQDYTPVWLFIFTRKLSAGQASYVNMQNNDYFGNFQKVLQDEALYIGINDDGLYYMTYQGPITVLETVTEQSNLKPFSEIRSIFERMVLLKDNTADHPYEGEVEHSDRYIVTEVRLNLVPVREQNKDTALFVPAWDFLGRYETVFPDGSVHVQNPDECYSFLTVNAVDGSIIDRTMGY